MAFGRSIRDAGSMTLGFSHPHDPDELNPGVPVLDGRFTIHSVLGRGDVATVYRIKAADGSFALLKVIDPRDFGDVEMESRFAHEVRLGRMLADLPFLVRIHETGRIPEIGNRLYMVQDDVPGPTLALRLASGALDPLNACKLVRELARAVAALHARSVVHRDLNPNNVVLARDDENSDEEVPKIIDLGCAHALGTNDAGTNTGATEARHRFATNLYVAPEQVLGMVPSPSADVYALAIVLYECLVGTPPHGEHPDAQQSSFSIAGRCDKLPRELEQLVDEGLQRDPALRISSAEVLVQRLDAVMAILATNVDTVGTSSKVEVSAEVADRPPTPDAAQRGELSVQRFSRGATIVARENLPPSVLLAPGLAARQKDEHEANDTHEVHESTADPPLNGGTRLGFDSRRTRDEAQPKRPPGIRTAPHRGRRRIWVATMIGLFGLSLGTVVLWHELSDPPPKSAAAFEHEPMIDEQTPRWSAVVVPPMPPVALPTPNLEVYGPPPPSETEAPPVDAISPIAGEVPTTDVTPPLAGEVPPVDATPPNVPAAPPPSPSNRPRAWTNPKAPECEKTRADAEAALDAKRWDDVLSLARRGRCWEQQGSNVHLRMTALTALGHYRECAQLGQNSPNAFIRGMGGTCAAKLGD